MEFPTVLNPRAIIRTSKLNTMTGEAFLIEPVKSQKDTFVDRHHKCDFVHHAVAFELEIWRYRARLVAHIIYDMIFP